MKSLETVSRASLRAGVGLASLVLAATPAFAQEASGSPAEQIAGDAVADTDIIVTGSRIGRSKTETPMPVTVIGSQVLEDRGFTTAAQALNTEPAINRQLNQAPGDGASSGDGIQAPSLFGLGTGRTLTLVNGRRMVTTSSGLEDAQVDANIVPLGLLQRIEVVQGGGAAVYGSDAIGGVVNYVLRKDFEGVEADFQTGITSRGDYPSYSGRLTAGTDFSGGRGNIAVDLGWSKTGYLAYGTRPRTRLDRINVSNPDDTGPDDGIPSSMPILGTTFWTDNFGGVIFSIPAPIDPFLTGLQFGGDGSVVPYNPGTIYGIPFASGGDGLRYQDYVTGLRTEVERYVANVVGHYDLTDNVTISTELLYARTLAREGGALPGNSTLGDDSTGTGAIEFTVDNAFLTPAAITAITNVVPDFATGTPLYLSKDWADLTNDLFRRYRTETYRAVLSLDGKFDIADRDFNWNLSGSYARVEGKRRSWGIIQNRLANALDARRDGAGQIICAINADADPSNDDSLCRPINPFGIGNVSDDARDYVNTRSGSRYMNEQIDLLATVNGSLFALPAGDVKAALTYEHRREKSVFTPFEADADGILTGGNVAIGGRGRYHTNEFAGEILVPLVGGDFTLPLVRSLEFSGAYRIVDNSIAGSENVWNVGLQWEPVDGVILRASRSRNFRAPPLNALFSPTSTQLDISGSDPCDKRNIAGGPNPTQRAAACLALFRANPAYGTGGPFGSPVGATAETRLANFQNSAGNFPTALVTTRGNPDLRNEISKTWTYGIVLQPSFVPGLTITADRVEIDLRDGFSAFTTEEFMSACYDDPEPAQEACDAFTRLANATPTSQAGSIATGTTTTFNAGIIRYRGESYTLNYDLPLSRLFASRNDRLEFNFSATHTTLLEASVTGSVFTRYDNSATNDLTGSAQPKWVGRANVNYTNGPFRVSYEGFYLGPVSAFPDATIESTSVPRIKSNLTHSVSAQVQLDGFTFRLGVNNLTDRQPSFPTLGYGDIIGRSYYAGVKVRF